MKLSFPPLHVGLIVCLSATALPGCGGSSIAVVPVQGKVTVDGQPVTSGQVSYVPTGQETPTGDISAGQIGSDGSYTIYTAGKAGAPPAKYKVTVTPSMVPVQGATKMPSTPFNEKYTQAQKTPLAVEVTANPAPGAYDLKLTK
jgi:hypothetical protein